MTTRDTAIDALLDIPGNAKIAHVAKEITINGVLTVDSDMPIIIAGKVVGEIVSNGTVILAETAEVNGPIHAENLQIAGTVVSGNGKIYVQGLLILNETAKVSVDAQYAKMKVDYGAQMSGSFQPHEMTNSAPVAKPKVEKSIEQVAQNSSENSDHSSTAAENDGDAANEHKPTHY